MSKLENLVPPLELCKRIPEGSFEDSALVWGNPKGWYPCLFPDVVSRDCCDDPSKVIAPAPTLAEILQALPRRNADLLPVCVTPELTTTDPDGFTDAWACGYRKIDPFVDPRPEVAALRLWLEL